MLAQRVASRCAVRCACGTEKVVSTKALVNGASRGCRACRSTRARRHLMGIEVGAVFGSWTVIGPAERVDGHTVHLCECGDCGSTHRVGAANLKTGQSKRCQDCSWASGAARTHGMTGSKEHAAWVAMVARCRPSSPARESYFDRGISVCPEWQSRGGFDRFFAHIGPAPSDEHSVDRINNDDGYRPGNVRWATRSEQARNTRRSRLIRFGDQLLTMEEAGARLGISRQAVQQRIGAGWTPIEAATTPKGHRAQRYVCGACGELGHNRRTCNTHQATAEVP